MDQELKNALLQILGSKPVTVLTQFAVGVGVLYVIVKFFKFVEELLADDTKREIKDWLLGVKVGQKVEPWPETFARVFDRVFGSKHLSWKCLGRSCAASFIVSAVTGVALYWINSTSSLSYFLLGINRSVSLFIVSMISGVLVTDYLALLATRWFLRVMQRTRCLVTQFVIMIVCTLFTTITITYGLVISEYWLIRSNGKTSLSSDLIYLIGKDPRYYVGTYGPARFEHLAVDYLVFKTTHPLVALKDIWAWNSPVNSMFDKSPFDFRFAFVAGFFTCVWLWLYAGSGFLLKAAHRFDIGFEWFNRKFDIEKKPLQSIGLVAGALVAAVYWAAVVVSHLL